MMLDNEQVDGTEEQSQDDSAGSADANALKAEIDFLKNQNAEVLNKFNNFLEAQNKPKEVNPMSKEEFSELLTKDPQAAIEYALSNKVNAQTSKIEKNLTSKQQQIYFDQKAEQDFPLLNTDKKFQQLVAEETRSLVTDGMSKDSPKLVYKAAEIVALKYKGAQDTKNESKGSMSSEAPSNVKRNDSKKDLPKNFDKMAAMFGLSDKAKARAAENIKFQQQYDAEKKNRG